MIVNIGEYLAAQFFLAYSEITGLTAMIYSLRHIVLFSSLVQCKLFSFWKHVIILLLFSFIYIILQCVCILNEMPVVNEECDSGISSFIIKLAVLK